MHILWWILSGFGILIAAIIVLGVTIATIERNRDRRVVKDQYEWLELCSQEEWKTSTTLLHEMRQLKNTERPLVMIFHCDIAKLEEEKLVMSRATEIFSPSLPYSIIKMEYLRSPWGGRRKRKREIKEQAAPDNLKPA